MTGDGRSADHEVVRVLAPDDAEDAAQAAEDLLVLDGAGLPAALAPLSAGLPEDLLDVVRRLGTPLVAPGRPTSADLVVDGRPGATAPPPGVTARVHRARAELPRPVADGRRWTGRTLARERRGGRSVLVVASGPDDAALVRRLRRRGADALLVPAAPSGRRRPAGLLDRHAVDGRAATRALADADVVVAPAGSVWHERALRARAVVVPPGPADAVLAAAVHALRRPDGGAPADAPADERGPTTRETAFLDAVRTALGPVPAPGAAPSTAAAGAVTARHPAEAVPSAAGRTLRRVLLMSSNGSGMGHLTRLAAMARRASPGTEVHVVSLSSAVTAGAGDLPHVYVPSAKDMGISPRRWDGVLARRLDEELERLRPDVLVFDGTHPYPALVDLAGRRGAPRLVWSRRPMWQAGRGAEDLLLARRFDLVVEPGELAAAHDRGLTRGRGDALTVRPVLLLDPEDAAPRAQARAELGVEDDAPTALVMLGAGRWYDAAAHQRELVDALSAAAPDVHVLVARPRIAEGAPDLGPARAVAVQPLARVMAGLDLVVTAAGYNTFHETVAAGRPGAFAGVPAQLDDQPQRSRWAQEAGVGLDLAVGSPLAPERLRAAARLLVDADAREACEARCRAVWPGNGAGDAMRAVEALADGADGRELVAASR